MSYGKTDPKLVAIDNDTRRVAAEQARQRAMLERTVIGLARAFELITELGQRVKRLEEAGPVPAPNADNQT